VVDILEGIIKALQLILSGDPALYGILYRSLLFSGLAIILATLWGTPIAMLLGLKDFRGKTVVKALFYSLIGIPTVVLGLILYLIFQKGGPLGFLQLVYTPGAIILGEAVLVTPILVSIATSAIEAVDPEIMSLSKTLGASESQASVAVLKEALNGVVLSNIASFNRAIAELGVALLVGGNIAGLTDVLTTAISRYTARGDLAFAIALGILLMAIVFGINIFVIAARKAKFLLTLGRSPQ
jgi:tungstate transport system permease protein